MITTPAQALAAAHYHQSRCAAKVRHLSRRDARRAARAFRAETGDRLRVYLCPICGFWHGTRNADREQGRAIAATLELLASWSQGPAWG